MSKTSKLFDRFKGPLLIFASSVVWSVSGVLAKTLDKYSPWSGFSKSGVRSVFAVIIYALYRRSFKVKVSWQLLIGALGVCLTGLLYMTAIRYTTSANAIVLQYSMPVYVVFFSWLLFKQKPRARDLIVVPLVLCGVILCCVGEMGGGMLGNIIALVSALTYACVFLAGKFKNADAVEYTYLGNLFSTLLIVSVFFDDNVHFGFDAGTLMEWAIVAALGVSLGGGYLLLALGMRHGVSPTTSAILSNLEPVLNPLWVSVFIGETPGTLGLIGMALVLVTVTVYSCLPEKKPVSSSINE